MLRTGNLNLSDFFRENVKVDRYVGDYIMNQNDVRDGGHFDDIAAYGGWTMDDHNPADKH